MKTTKSNLITVQCNNIISGERCTKKIRVHKSSPKSWLYLCGECNWAMQYKRDREMDRIRKQKALPGSVVRIDDYEIYHGKWEKKREDNFKELIVTVIDVAVDDRFSCYDLYTAIIGSGTVIRFKTQDIVQVYKF